MGDKRTLLDAMQSVPVNDGSKGLADLVEMNDGQTVEELMVESGKGDAWVRSRLKSLLAQGLLIVGKKQMTNLIGQKAWTYVYKITDAPKAK